MTETVHTTPYPSGGWVHHVIADEDGTVRVPYSWDKAPFQIPSGSRVPDVVEALRARSLARGDVDWSSGDFPHLDDCLPKLDRFGARVLLLPRSERWREAVSTALLGSWCGDSLKVPGDKLPPTVLGVLKAEARALHRQSIPLWRRRTRHGRVLSLDADLGSGLSLYDLVAAEVDLLAHTSGGVFEDDRLNRVLHGLKQAERLVALAYAEGEGATWAEAAAAAAATHPEVFSGATYATDSEALGERVRRKVKRLGAEQVRRACQSRA
ncbi:hypothetical protein ABT300_38140 [Streptomyces sp. NPDC001027]|uniref:hypothetical protein n=1 Tax=Streptomyces sp. NPDC001027 TaxID=3154771 RepID=UPI0033344300